MQISHVIRGEEWLPSAPLHVLLYKYLGLEEYMPQFAHLPLLLRPDGNGKLSKRDGDRLGFPVFPLRWIDPKSGEVSSGYRESGYLPAAFINMLSLLGWNPGDDKEIFSMSELIESFSLERVSKSGAKFDVEKAQWFNHQYIMKLSPKALSEYLFPILAENDQHSDPSFVIQVCALIQDRVSLIPDLWKQSSFFFLDPDSYDENVISKIWKSDTSLILRDFAEFLQYIEPFDKETLEFQIKEFVAKKGIGIGQLMNPFRLAVVGSNFGPGMIDIAALLGKERVISRIRKGINVIKI
jgi:glutamyl-tRNA synthetase